MLKLSLEISPKMHQLWASKRSLNVLFVCQKLPYTVNTGIGKTLSTVLLCTLTVHKSGF
jgi:hypothetical protein